MKVPQYEATLPLFKQQRKIKSKTFKIMSNYSSNRTSKKNLKKDKVFGDIDGGKSSLKNFVHISLNKMR